jgi:alpha-ketoglutarate-dependent taurine dioxygenase
MTEKPGSVTWQRRRPQQPRVATHDYGAAGYPLVYEAEDGVDLLAWASDKRGELREVLLSTGALLFRGFSGVSVEVFSDFVQFVSGDPLAYVERSSPRSAVKDHIYTSTDHPPDRRIVLHCEQSYNVVWPLHIFFHCVQDAAIGGETPVASTRRVWDSLSENTKKTFDARGYCYVRNFRPGLGLDWRDAFATTDRGEVVAYCRDHDIECRWLSDSHLRTLQRRPARAIHPVLGENLWFNHIAFFHSSSLDPDVLAALRTSYDEEDFPNNVFYGDGEPIAADRVAEIRACLDRHAVAVAWRRGDILWLDNMLMAHGRMPFSGARKIVVAMSAPSERSNGSGRDGH